MSTIDEIKARIDIIDLVSGSVQLRRTGKNYTGFCPFHTNTRTPAFVVFPESGTWRCFGQCNEGGDIFKFVMKKEGWDFPEALRYLAEKAGVQLKPVTPEDQAAEEEHQALRDLLENAAVFYQHQLFHTPAGQQALEYLRSKRNLKDETIEAFGLGYAPLSWDAVLNHLKEKGYEEKDILETGLITEREADETHQRTRIYDRFRHRLMFPIRDERGRMVGFGGRILNPDDVPKFINSPQTVLFDKGRTLYGLDRARKAIRTREEAVIVEGYLDVIALHQAGFLNTVSPMGTALTEPQLLMLKRLTGSRRRIVLALDPDAAGDKATMRGLQLARDAMDRESDPVFDARGLLGYEARLQADIRVSTLPEGEDPDEVVNRDPQAWEKILEDARPVVVHVMETLAAGRNLDDPKVKTDIAAQVLPLIQDVPNAIERDTYRQRLARLLRVDERALVESRMEQRTHRPGPRRQQIARLEQPALAEKLSAAQASGYLLEAHCLGILLRRPDLLYRVDRALQTAGLMRLTAEDFQHGDHQAIITLLQQAVDQDITEPLRYVLDNLSLPMMELADGLLARTEKLDPNDERVLEDLVRDLVMLRSRRLHQEIEYVQYLMEEAQNQGDARAGQYLQTMVQLTRVKKKLQEALGQFSNRSTASQ